MSQQTVYKGLGSKYFTGFVSHMVSVATIQDSSSHCWAKTAGAPM